MIDPSGVVLTSAHLVGDSTKVAIVVEDTRLLVGTVIRIDETRDLALIELPPGSYPWAYLGDGSDVILGAPVFAVGYALNLEGSATVTTGIVSRVLYESEYQREVIQTDAAINLGTSGGPVVDANGKVIGIITSFLGEYESQDTRGIGFAVSINTIREDFLASASIRNASLSF